jgi:hypothetical protein
LVVAGRDWSTATRQKKPLASSRYAHRQTGTIAMMMNAVYISDARPYMLSSRRRK